MSNTDRALVRGAFLHLILGAVAGVAFGLAVQACYPDECDPDKDPTGCRCPPGACGPYPSPPDIGATRDAGEDG